MKFIRKKIIQTGIFCTTLFYLSACQKDFSINADCENFPIVYALFNIDEQDSMQYIKIYKSYLTDNVYEGAKQLSLYSYMDSIEVSVEEYNKKDILLRTITFDTTTSIPKDSGIFSYPTQILYAAPLKCNKDYTYKVKVFNPYTKILVEGTTNVPGVISISQPHHGLIRPTFVSITDNNFDVAFKTTDNAVAYQIVAKYYYAEIYKDGSVIHCQPITWNIGTATTTEAQVLHKMSVSTGSGFFRAIANGVEDNENVIRRYTDSIVFEIQAAAIDWYNYLLATKPISTINQERIAYTNIKAYNIESNEEAYAIGFVSARSVSRLTFDDLLKPGSRDSLFNGRFTGHLKFSDIH